MVSGLVTSPWDQLRIFSGEARLIRMESKSAIKFALSYGEDLYISSPIKLFQAADERRFTQISPISVHPRLSAAINLRLAQCPKLPAASSSTPRPDTATAARGSGR